MERARENVKSAFPTEPGTEWAKWLELATSEFEDLLATIITVNDGQFVETATRAQLEKIGAMFDLPRHTGETDTHYRKRIQLQIPSYTTGATIPDLLRLSELLLECDPENISLIESFDLEPARIDVLVDEHVLSNIGVTVDEYVDLLTLVKPAGVRLVATIGEQFTYRSVYEFRNGFNNPNKGYGDIDDPAVGGGYADQITARLDDEDTPPVVHPPFVESEKGFGVGGYGEGGYGT